MDPSDPQLRHYQNQYPHQDQSHPYDPSQSQSYEAYYAAYHHHHQQQQHYEPSAYHQPSAVVDPTTPQIHHGYSAQPDQHHPAPAAELYGGGAHHHHHHQLYQYPVSHHYPVVEQGQVAVRHGGGARRGSGPFRGGSRRGSGRGNPSHRPPPSFRGRGRGRGRMGRGGGRKPHQPSADPQPTDSSTVGPLLEPGRELPAPPQSAAATRKKERPNPLLTWCDICRVDCNSLEILQQHKNGKRHKKTVQRFEEIQRQQKLYGELQGTPLPSTELSSAGVGEEANIVYSGPENIPNSDTLNKMPISVDYSESDVNKGQTAEGHLEPSKVEEPPHATNEPSSVLPISEVPHAEGGSTGQPRNDVPRGGMKRKITKSGRGGKRLKSNDQARGRAPERSRVCTLCSVMCETSTVFESHVAGKKHISKLKRFQGHGSVYGPITVYIPPNQPSAYPAQGQEPLFFGLKSHEMVQAEMYGGMNGLQPEYYGHQHVGEVGWNPHVALLESSHNGGKVGWNPHITLPDSSQAVIQNDIVPGTTEEPETTEHEGLGINVEPDAAGDEVLPSAIGKDIVTLPEVTATFRE